MGGMERACAELIRRGAKRFQFTVVTSSIDPDLLPLVQEWIRVRIPRRPSALRFSTFFIRAGAALRGLDSDLVHTIGAIVPNRAQLITVHFCHAGYRDLKMSKDSSERPLRRANSALASLAALSAERWCYRTSRLNRFAVVSQGAGTEISRYYKGIPIGLAPNGVDTHRFRPDPVVRSSFRKEMSVEGDVVALFVGGDWHRKGLDLAIEGVGIARRAGRPLSLWVVGAGDYVHFRRTAEKAGLTRHVKFFGPRAATERFYQSADVCVLPSSYENFSLVSLEAAACGLPIIITPVHGSSELVGKNEGGLIIDRSADSLGKALTSLSGPGLMNRLGREAQRRAKVYDWGGSAQATFRMYDSLLSEQKGESNSQ